MPRRITDKAFGKIIPCPVAECIGRFVGPNERVNFDRF
jgi:hypothetical protein